MLKKSQSPDSRNKRHEAKRKHCELYLDEFRLELLRNIYMLLLKKGIQDGITQALKRYAKVNNKYMKDQYKSDGTITYLQYLDADSLSIYDKTDQLVKKKERVYLRS